MKASHPAVSAGRIGAYLYACIARRSATIASHDLAAATGVNATQVRRDLSQLLGRSGKRGVGYRTSELARRLRDLIEGTEASPGALLIAAARAGADVEEGLSERTREIASLITEGASIARRIDALIAEDVAAA